MGEGGTLRIARGAPEARRACKNGRAGGTTRPMSGRAAFHGGARARSSAVHRSSS